MPVEFTCRYCGGSNVLRDAWAEWNAANQEWVLADTFLNAYCRDCDCETKLIERELEAAASSAA